MNTRKLLFLSISLTLGLLIINGCKGKMNGGGGTLNIHDSADPDMLNPINLSTSNARIIANLMFSTLIGNEPTGEYNLTPILIKENAKISEITEGEFKGGMKLEYEIREDATWDNGTPITAHDYAFSIKAILNPKTNCEPLKGYYEWLADIVIDSSNPKKFVVYSNKKYFKIEEFAGGYVIPEYNYDPNKLMRKFTIRDMNTNDKRNALKTNADIINFATEFNSEKYQRDPKFITGAGPYKLDHWTTGQEVVLVRKTNWWGDKYKEIRDFWSFPKKIKIKIINDQNTSLTALKDGQIDAYAAIPAKDFKELEKNDKFKEKFELSKIDRFAYTFLGLNTRRDKFKDVNVRRALAHIINRDKINEIISYGEAIKTESFAHPSQSIYNKNLKPYDFDLTKAAQLLDAAGWKDSDGDGIRDKVINGKKTALEIEYKYAKSETAKNTALIIKDDMDKVGIKFNIVEKEWTVYVQELDKFDFDMYNIGFTISPRVSDPKQQWHTSSAVPGGSNNVGWGNAKTDKMIETLISDLNPENRNKIYMDLQQMIHDDVPVIFLFSPKNRMAVNKNFSIEKIMISPGFLYNEFKLVK